MEVNMVLALILSHQFDKARQTLSQIQGMKVNNHPALKTISVYFILKDKNYDKALEMLDGAKEVNLVFLRS